MPVAMTHKNSPPAADPKSVDVPVPLMVTLPYPHQVGGHGQLVQSAPGTVMKPLLKKEAAFYEYVYARSGHPQVLWLRAATPEYYGTREIFRAHAPPPADAAAHPVLHPVSSVQAAAERDVAGRIAETRTFSSAALSPWAAQMVVRQAARRRPPALVRAEGLGDAASAAVTLGAGAAPMAPPSSGGGDSSGGGAVSGDDALERDLVVVLEDINSQFRKPCVLDVKIGLRHYDDDATPEKRRRHIEKANSTTTAETGMRIIGLQVWKGAAAGYEFRDKYAGRRLKKDDLVPQMRWFFHNGSRLRTDAIKLTILQLREIERRMQEQRTFMFYSSSVLITYEGMDACTAEDGEKPLSARDADQESVGQAAVSSGTTTSRVARTVPSGAVGSNGSASFVDVRMIDFAHTQFSSGQIDTGYLYGIGNLIAVLCRLLDDEMQGSSASGVADSVDDTVEAGSTVPETIVGNGAYADGIAERSDNKAEDLIGTASATLPVSSRQRSNGMPGETAADTTATSIWRQAGTGLFRSFTDG